MDLKSRKGSEDAQHIEQMWPTEQQSAKERKKKCLSFSSNNTNMYIWYIVFYPKYILMRYIHVKNIKMSCLFMW